MGGSFTHTQPRDEQCNKNVFNERLMRWIFFFQIRASLPQSNPICNSSSHFSHITNTYIIREVDKSPEAFRWAAYAELLFGCGSLTSLTLSPSWLMLPLPVMITRLEGLELENAFVFGMTSLILHSDQPIHHQMLASLLAR